MVIRRIGVWSVARMYGTVSALMGLLFGAVLAVLSLVGAGLAGRNEELSSFMAPAFGVGAVIFLPICYGVMGVIVGALGATFYNIFAGMVGGVEIEVQQ